MSIAFFMVDAFTAVPFHGNSAAVVLPGSWPATATMQALSREFNQTATCFVVPEGDGWRLRWFNPRIELDICGHGTLAATHVLARELGVDQPVFRFSTAAGDLGVKCSSTYELSLPREEPEPIEEPGRLSDAIGVRPQGVFRVRRTGNQQVLLVTLPDQDAVARLSPHQAALAAVGVKALIVTAPGTDVDFVCRYFSPSSGVPEDPITGSAFASLAPFWGGRLGKDDLSARQVSKRGGDISCRIFETRVVLGGEAVTVLRGEVEPGILA